jgi:periplasmic divalent cation tolerance protein
MSNVIEVTTTLDSDHAARHLSDLIVTARLAACVQITGPIQSLYRWQGEICQAQEWRCTMKSLESVADKLVQFIQSNHPYEVPEILVCVVQSPSESYFNWLTEQIASS